MEIGNFEFTGDEITWKGQKVFGVYGPESQGRPAWFFKLRSGHGLVLAVEGADPKTLAGHVCYAKVKTYMCRPAWWPKLFGGPHIVVAGVPLIPQFEDTGPMDMNTNDGIKALLDIRIRFKIVNLARYAVNMAPNRKRAFAETISSALNTVTSNFGARELVFMAGTEEGALMAFARQQARINLQAHGQDTVSVMNLNREALEIKNTLENDEGLKNVLKELNLKFLAEQAQKVLLDPSFQGEFGVEVTEAGIESIDLPDDVKQAEQARIAAKAGREAAADVAASTKQKMGAFRDAFLPAVGPIVRAVSQAIRNEVVEPTTLEEDRS